MRINQSMTAIAAIQAVETNHLISAAMA